MAAAQAGDRVAYETFLRDCVSLIVNIARRQGIPSDRTDDVANGAPELSVAARQVKPAWVKASATAALADCVVIKMRQAVK